MSAWSERILQEFPADISRFWIACDPDDLLLDERILHALRERGFEVMPFEDSVAFRTEYEERYHAAWDCAREGFANSLILQLRGTDLNTLPWDYIRIGRKAGLSLADLLPRLNYAVLRQIEPEYHEALFDAHNKHAGQSLGEGATKDFILMHLFGLSPYLISNTSDLWRDLLRLHFSDKVVPAVLARHMASVLAANPAFRELELEKLLVSKAAVLESVQGAWGDFIHQHGVQEGTAEFIGAEEKIQSAIPFEHPDIRAFVDSMFLDGALQPLATEGIAQNLPQWARVGIVEDPRALGRLVADASDRLMETLPELDASHREWFQVSRRLGEVLARYHGLPADRATALSEQIRELQDEANRRLRDWVARHYSDLASLPAAKAPVMVHHVPRFLAHRRSDGEQRIALVVFDGMAMDQWIQMRGILRGRAPEISFEDGACFAWAPTLTAVSRQALFSGLRPREFAASIETTAQEAALWARHWQDCGLRSSDVVYRKGLKRTDQLAELATAITNPSVKAAGIVVDTIDEIMHGAILGKRGIANQIASWCETGFLERFLRLLLDQGFAVYLTADHGNVEAEGIGRPNQGVAAELRGERVRVYRSAALADALPAEFDAFRLDLPGLPTDFLPVYPAGRGAFVGRGDQIVAHGGLSVEELLVPFVRVSY